MPVDTIAEEPLKEAAYIDHSTRHPEPAEMSLLEALSILVESHTREDDEIKFTIPIGAAPPPYMRSHDYIRAWTAVRRAVGRPA